MINLMIRSIREPERAWATLAAQNLPMSARWSLLIAVSACAAILSWLGLQILSAAAVEGEASIIRLAAHPMSMAGMQVAAGALSAGLLAGVGRMFGGQGSFPDALLAIGWIEAIMCALQAVQIVLTLVLPPVGALFGFVILGLAGWLLVSFTMAVHGFRNPLLVVMGIIGTVMVSGLILSILAAALGLMPEIPA